MILYFTGTGNSRHIAQLMAENLKDEIIDVTKLIKNGKTGEFTSEKPYIFVAPTYAWRIPKIFKEWIEKSRFGINKNAYFVLTCGSEIGAAGNYIEKFATKKGFIYQGSAQVVMPENYLIMFDPTPKEKDAEIIMSATENTIKLCEKIANGHAFDRVEIPFVGHLQSGIVNSSFYTFYVSAKKFYHTDACISCGKCVENCMTNNITLKDGQPVWGKNCTHCMACICKCPTEAIEYGKNTKGKRRYVFKTDKE